MSRDMTTDGQRIQIAVRGVAAIDAAARGADLYVGTADGWQLVAPDRREWVIARARNKRSKVSADLFGSTGLRFDAHGGVHRDGERNPAV